MEEIEPCIAKLQSFAKEKWGEEVYMTEDHEPILAWQYHLAKLITDTEL